jgi:hypothetical protein
MLGPTEGRLVGIGGTSQGQIARATKTAARALSTWFNRGAGSLTAITKRAPA